MRTRAGTIARILAAPALAVLVATSCPNPIDDELLLVVDDDTAPLVTITSPAEDSTYRYAVSVTGILLDSSQSAGDGRGFVRTLEFDVSNDDDLTRTITFEREGRWTVYPPDPTFDFDLSTGAFAFTVDTSGLTGGHRFIFTATDLNANETEQEVRVQSAAVGPDIKINDSCPILYSSKVTTSIEIQGWVDPAHFDPGTAAYTVEPATGFDRIDIPFTPGTRWGVQLHVRSTVSQQDVRKVDHQGARSGPNRSPNRGDAQHRRRSRRPLRDLLYRLRCHVDEHHNHFARVRHHRRHQRDEPDAVQE